jgi:D-alanyl-D-alanine carboxypeptidase (penicillin-binding protein 5/6)
VAVLAVLVTAGLSPVAHSAPRAIPPSPALDATPPAVDASAYIVANAATGDVLAQHHSSAELPIASITKLMTVIVALQHLRLDDVVRVDRPAAVVGESSINLRPGEVISVRDLLAGALIQSANDAADALADAAANGDRSLFVRWMNEKATQLGLHGTHFVRADGLDAPGHFSTARDVLKLAEVAMHTRVVRQLVRERSETIAGGRLLHTWNDLLGVFPGLIGVKTGHTSASGWCQVAAARRSGYTIYAVILGSPTRAGRNADLAALLRWGVSRYRVGPVIRAGRSYATAELGWGKRPVRLVARRPLVRAYRVDRPLVEKVVARSVVPLPVARGRVVGRVEMWEGSRLLGARPLVAARAVGKPTLAGRVGFFARRTVHHVLGFFS